MTLFIDASSPALVTGANTSSTVTSAAFNPPAGSVLVACVPANSGSATSPTITVTDSNGTLVWTSRAVANFGSATARRGSDSIFTAPCPSALTGLTVTVTTGGATTTTRRPSLKVYVVTGQDAANLVAGSGISGSVANSYATTLTQAAASSLLIVCASEWQKLGVPSSPDLTASPFDQAGADGVSGLTGYRTLDAAVGSESFTLDAFGAAAAEWNAAWIELTPIALPTVNAGADAAVTLPAAFTRTATETGTVTSRAWTIVSGPAGVGTTIATTAALTWSPSTAGTYVLRYTASNAGGSGTDDVTVTVSPAGSTTRTNLGKHPAYALGTSGGAQWFGATGSGPATGVVGMDRDTGFSDPAGAGNIATPRATVTAGLSYAASIQVRADVAGTVTVGVDWYSATGYLSSSATTAATFAAGAPQRIGVLAAAPATAVEGLLTIQHPASAIIATALLWEQATAHGTYFDGETAGAAWTGTRYTSTSTLTVAPAAAPVVGAGADAALTLPATFTRTATETGTGITSRAWTILSGPADVGATLSTVATLTGWAPTVAGTYVLRYTATNAGGPGTDDVTVTVTAAPTEGVPFLTAELGPNARLAVEIAWGADLTADPAGWVWTDVTGDVRHDPGISTSLGRADEAATTQPATLNVTLDNTRARYSLGGQSPNWPYVRRNVPVRAQIDLDGTGFRVLFIGYATGFTPSWNLRGTVAEVELEAAGTLRRLLQGASPLVSALRRGLLDQPDTVAYWPGEDGKNATSLAPVVGAEPMNIAAGTPKFGASTLFDASGPLPELNGAVLDGGVTPYSATGKNQVRMLFAFPAGDAAPDGTCLFRVLTTGTAARWDVLYKAGGQFQLNVYDRFGGALYTGGTVAFGVNGTGRFYSLELAQSGADVVWTIGTLQPYVKLGYLTATLAGATCGTVTRVIVNPSGALTDTGCGHIVVQRDVTNRYALQDELDAHNGELVTSGGRLPRLCAENGVALEILGPSEFQTSPADRVGPQREATLLELLRDGEAVGQGVLYDGRAAGLTYSTKRDRENRPADLTISAATAKLSSPFGPVDDDQRTRNRVEVKRDGGSSAVVEDTTGPLGTAAIGVYESSVTLAAHQDGALPLFAAWFVSQGTLEGYRYPALTVDLRAAPALASAILAARPGHRVDVTGLSTVLPGHPSGTLSLLVEGVQHRITATTWTATLKCSPYAVWRIGVVAAETGELGEYVARAGGDASTVNTSASAGATTLSVATAAGGSLWTTAADDYPLTLDVGGYPVTATACTGATSPQAFTVAAVPAALPAGVPVALWNPTRLGL